MTKREASNAGSSAKPIAANLVGDLLRVVDLAIILVIGLGIYLVYVYPEEPETLSRYLVALALTALMVGVLFQWFGVYGGDYVFVRGLNTDQMLSAWAVTFALLLAVAFALKISNYYSRVWAVSWFFAAAWLLTLGRLGLSYWILRLARAGRFANRSVIVGTGEQAQKLAAHLQEYDSVRTQLLGLIDDLDGADEPLRGDAACLGGIEDLVRMIRGDEVDQVFIALPWNDAERLRAAVHRLAVMPVMIRLAPDVAGFDYAGRAFAEVAGLPMLRLFDRPISGWSHLTKAAEDRLLSALFLIVLAPALLLIALLIRLDSPGPALFRQNRYGFNNQLIEVWKFRTMYHHLADPEACELTTKDDDRVTRLGGFLRRTSLDELPQLINVLKGEMSLVGPRPHAVAAKAGGQLYYEAVDHYAARHKVKPGITGWAQVNGWRGETDTVEKIRKRVECDLYYIDNWSVWLDLVILARTIATLLKGERAY